MDLFHFEPLKQVPRGVIVDTDIGPDCDDVGALAVLHVLAEKYQIPILGIVNCTSNIYGCGAIDVVGKYCGNGNVPVGIYGKSGFLDGPETMYYNRYLTETFHSIYAPKHETGGEVVCRADGQKPEEAVALYRRLLAEAAPKSIMLITIGPLNNLADLLQSGGDAVSPKSGRELVAEKVYAVVAMAGCTKTKQREYNIICDAEAAQIFLETIPVPVIFSGFEVGLAVMSGFYGKTPENAEQNPIFQAYRLYSEKAFQNDDYINRSFDLTAVQFAFEGEGAYYRMSGPGTMKIDRGAEDATEFVLHPEGSQYYMELACEAQALSALLSEYLLHAGNC